MLGQQAERGLSEREVKLAAAPSFRMPSPDELVDGLAASTREPERLSTTYLDSDDLRLARWGVSFRHRVGQGWTVKLPPEDAGALLVRPELTFDGEGRRPPAEAVDLVRSFIRTAELRPQTRLRTVRRRIELHDPEGSLLADIADDEVSVLEGRRLAARFRELEVEIREETPPGLLEALVNRLREAGAGAPDPTPKYIRALGPRALQPPEVPIPELVSGATAGDVVRRAIASSVVRLIQHDPVVRLDTDPEGVHQARVATRRLRSDLRTFRPLIDPSWAAALRDELGWLAGALGAVRDADVLLARIGRRAARLPESTGRGALRVLAALESARGEAYAELLTTLRTEPYLALLDRLVAAGNAPSLLLESDLPAATVLPGLVRGPWRSLARRVKSLDRTPTDAELHDVRIRTKRVRYAAEAVAPLVGKQARTFAAAAAALQDVLGDLNDAVVAERWLRNWASRSRSLPGVFAAGELAGLESAAADECRARWRTGWKELSSPRLRAWM
ncbi:MAG: CHAD domain containing protein [Candidatus Rokuibacteriota bacterium]|nr:MAG: CHAD domain containing protein [Candidatus Rokubacteria bacterium]